MERGRTEIRGRATSPEYYSDSGRTRSQSPAGSFYHNDHSHYSGTPTRAAIPTTPTKTAVTVSPISWRPTFELLNSWYPSSFSTSYDNTPSTPYTNDFPTLASIPLSHADVVEGPINIPRVLRNAVPIFGRISVPISPGTFGQIPLYQYTPLSAGEIRLLRIAPGPFKSHMFCSLKVVPLEKLEAVVHEFQALSYSWGKEAPDHVIFLSDLPKMGSGKHSGDLASVDHRAYLVRRNLYQALRHIRLVDDHSWVWVDALCIEQTNEDEKSRQIPVMPHIYSSAWNVIAWLGDDDSMKGNIEGALSLIPNILNLKMLDTILRGNTPSEETLRSWLSFGQLLQLPWFARRWVIQEVACARRLSVRIGERILSWQDFADAVDLYVDNIDRIRELYSQSTLSENDPAALNVIEESKAVVLMKFSRSVFRESSDSLVVSRLMSLESLVLTASSFAVSDVRDTIYALLYLADDRYDAIVTLFRSTTQCACTRHYSQHAVDIFLEFVHYCMARSMSLDIIFRPWASWPRSKRRQEYNGRYLPTWVRVASFGEDGFNQRHVSREDLLGPVGSQVYNASRGVTMRTSTISPTIRHLLQADGIVLGSVEKVSTCIRGGNLKARCLRMLGWSGTLEDGICDRLWRTLVANRNSEGKTAPTWYRRACALALTKLNDNGDLTITDLLRDRSQPSTMIDYLKRVQTATRDRKVFRCASSQTSSDAAKAQEWMRETIVGIGPEIIGVHDDHCVCILFGCSVPVVLNRSTFYDGTRHVTLVGPCYVHGYMEGELFAGMSPEQIQEMTVTFSIH